MTVISTANPTADTSALVAELGGQASQSVDFMIGVGLVKDSDAVFFQYQGDEQKTALMEASGKPCTRIGQVFLLASPSLTMSTKTLASAVASSMSSLRLRLVRP